ncbi:Bro-N domain-containing protein [Salmonella enterica]|uniref:BRO-N domain-containing protein n=1 Tax=Salmonella enterica TaxID=28901 RepID=UPI0003BD0A6A|nr:BRO family protein [Salmonella enterica]EBG8223102.1 antirepressor protein [Salmonella enterica subsp. enterica]ECA9846096.1 antirepressor protein [Salmonella enterica subsp. enterica serovar Essen]ECD8386908.1 antirepressor protein [Salmonella enterica subsp. enterica serovar Stockholm]EIM5303160.1 antirepressor protein [Salmonella enterica subsp. enterica serovar Mokola]AKW15016.1 antirepressor protein [Salmonella enterica subsp. enterica serovar Sloterdijk str. ATCC 15791]
MKKKNSGFTANGQTRPESGQKSVFTTNNSDISIIRFEGVKVRIVKMNGEPWFVAVDVCRALEIDNPTKAVKALDADENTLTSIQGIHSGRGNPVVNAVSESGFYKLIARSRKASTPDTFAHRFSNWVFREVIPSIRKTGSYGVPFAFLNDYSRRKDLYTKKASKRGYDLQACKGEKSRLIAEEDELWRKYQPELPEVHS